MFSFVYVFDLILNKILLIFLDCFVYFVINLYFKRIIFGKFIVICSLNFDKFVYMK